MNNVQWPNDLAIEPLSKHHHRDSFESGVLSVDEWLKTRARQAQDKRLSITRVLCTGEQSVIGYYTLAMGLVNFDELPLNIARKLPETRLPIITLAWLGIDKRHQKKGLGERLLAQALRDCYQTGQMLPFIAILLDCATQAAKRFYQRYDFKELPGHPMTLMLPWKLLNAMMQE